MLKILWKRGKIAPEEQFLPLSTIFYYLMLDFYVKTGIRFSLRDKRLFEITEVEITRVDCIKSLLRLLGYPKWSKIDQFVHFYPDMPDILLEKMSVYVWPLIALFNRPVNQLFIITYDL